MSIGPGGETPALYGRRDARRYSSSGFARWAEFFREGKDGTRPNDAPSEVL